MFNIDPNELSADEIEKSNGEIIPSLRNRVYAREQSKSISQMVSSPDKIAKIQATISDNLSDVAPDIAKNMADKLINNVSYLAAKAPKNTESSLSSLTPNVADTWLPGHADTIKYLRYVDAVDNPLAVLHGIASGKINNEGLEVVRDLYPALKDKFAQELIEQTGKYDTPIPYNKRVALAVLLGIPNADATLVPRYIKSMQSMQQQTPTSDSQQGRPVTAAAAKSFTKLGQQNMTSTQKLATGGTY